MVAPLNPGVASAGMDFGVIAANIVSEFYYFDTPGVPHVYCKRGRIFQVFKLLEYNLNSQSLYVHSVTNDRKNTLHSCDSDT